MHTDGGAVQCRTTAGSAPATRRTRCRAPRRPHGSSRASTHRAPSTHVAATPVSAGGVSASFTQLARSSNNRPTKTTTSSAQISAPTINQNRETHSNPTIFRATDTMPVDIAAAPAPAGMASARGRSRPHTGRRTPPHDARVGRRPPDSTVPLGFRCAPRPYAPSSTEGGSHVACNRRTLSLRPATTLTDRKSVSARPCSRRGVFFTRSPCPQTCARCTGRAGGTGRLLPGPVESDKGSGRRTA